MQATNQTTMPRRRALLGAGAAAAFAAVIAPAAAEGGPDTSLIALCAEHVANMTAYNHGDGPDMEFDDDPLWLAYSRTRDAITDAKPHTLAGMLAKARAAKAEAMDRDGSVRPEGSMGSDWAWDLMNDLLRLHGAQA